MTEIKINISDYCENCKAGLKYLKKLKKRNKKAYANFVMPDVKKLIKEKRDLGKEDRIKGIKLIPDYNSKGYLTHFHIQEE